MAVNKKTKNSIIGSVTEINIKSKTVGEKASKRMQSKRIK